MQAFQVGRAIQQSCRGRWTTKSKSEDLHKKNTAGQSTAAAGEKSSSDQTEPPNRITGSIQSAPSPHPNQPKQSQITEQAPEFARKFTWKSKLYAQNSKTKCQTARKPPSFQQRSPMLGGSGREHSNRWNGNAARMAESVPDWRERGHSAARGVRRARSSLPPAAGDLEPAEIDRIWKRRRRRSWGDRGHEGVGIKKRDYN
jgi:hypothetical protein